MKTNLIISAMFALSVAASGNALAQHNPHNDSDGVSRHYLKQKQNDRYDGISRRGNVDNRSVEHYQRSNYPQQYHSGVTGGNTLKHDYRRGQPVYRQNRNDRHVTVGKTVHDLSAPDRGHR